MIKSCIHILIKYSAIFSSTFYYLKGMESIILDENVFEVQAPDSSSMKEPLNKRQRITSPPHIKSSETPQMKKIWKSFSSFWIEFMPSNLSKTHTQGWLWVNVYINTVVLIILKIFIFEYLPFLILYCTEFFYLYLLIYLSSSFVKKISPSILFISITTIISKILLLNDEEE